GERGGGDRLGVGGGGMTQETWLLCFDEFHVTDIADAMILGRLFQRLFELGVVVVATSNVAPSELYQDGLNRALFLPFIALIEEHMEVVQLNARADFRLEKLGGAPVWYVPADRAAEAALDEAWRRLTAGHAGELAAFACRARPWEWRASRFTICANSRWPPPIISRSRASTTPSSSIISR